MNGAGMRFDPGARTALAFVTLRSDGEREFMFYRNPSADMLLQEAELDLSLITKVLQDDTSFIFFLNVIIKTNRRASGKKKTYKKIVTEKSTSTVKFAVTERAYILSLSIVSYTQFNNTCCHMICSRQQGLEF